MTEKRFNFNISLAEDEHKGLIFDNGQVMKTIDVAYVLNEQHETITTLTSALKELKEIGDYQADQIKELTEENEQLTQQLQIFEKFLEGNDLSIDWEEFCGLEECAFENPNFSCKTCIYLKGDDVND